MTLIEFDNKKPISILYQDQHYVAVYKPQNLLVHKTQISSDKTALLQILRNQIGQHVYPVHRLDRPTAGVVLFGLSGDAVEKIKNQFTEQTLTKTYWAIVRGFTDPSGHIDHDVREDPTKPWQSAITNYKTLGTKEIDWPVGRYQTARYSWIEALPSTGRMHQIRKHMVHLRHPIVGDMVYGDRDHNRFWQNELGYKRLWLLAKSLKWVHPYTQQEIQIDCELDADWQTITNHFLRADLRFLTKEKTANKMAMPP